MWLISSRSEAIASTVIESTLLQSALRQILHGLRSMDRIGKPQVASVRVQDGAKVTRVQVPSHGRFVSFSGRGRLDDADWDRCNGDDKLMSCWISLVRPCEGFT